MNFKIKNGMIWVVTLLLVLGATLLITKCFG